jgi:hypothetical protein
MSRWIAPLIVALLLSVSSLTPAGATPAAECGYPDVNQDGAIVLTGDGKLNSRPFDLGGAAYTVKWSGEMKGQFGGNLIVTLKRTDGAFFNELLVNTILNPEQPKASGETQVYGTKAGPYDLDVTASGPWTVTITPQ